MILKDYQKKTLRVLGTFFGNARIHGAKTAYEKITTNDEQAKRLRGYAGKYEPLNGLESVPYICLRLPTGGGKTLLATHAILHARDSWLEKEFPVVVWLVPSDTIRRQTVEALKNPRHAYRQSLDDNFQGRVRIFDIADFGQATPSDLSRNLCVFVGTIQTLKITDTNKRKVYAHNENLEAHFSKVAPHTPNLERNNDGPFKGDIKFSFANLLHLHNPLVIVDEAHNAVTGLTNDMQQRINPSAIVEFTATPRKRSNILHSVSAQELKDEEMIKMPVVLEEHRTWQEAINGAILKRAELEEVAKLDAEAYIRPIVLFQAENKDRDVNVTVLRDHLVETKGIPVESIAVVTGDQRDLDDINLMDANCPIDYVITVQALKEGWDCSFAYVFCSVANIKSSGDAEQLLGRVLRMPYAQKRKAPELNKAYASLTSKHFKEALEGLVDKLIDMGFDESEVRENVETTQPELADDMFGRQRRKKPQATIALDETPEAVQAAVAAAPGKVAVKANETGKAEITVTGFLRPTEKQAVIASAPERSRKKLEAAIETFEAANMHEASPAQRDEEFIVPRLMAGIQGELEFADSDILFEYHDWSLKDHSPQLSETEFSIKQTGEAFEIDLDDGKIFVQNSDLSEQLAMDIDVEGWTEAGLVQWLDRKVRNQFIGQGELVAWLAAVVRHLTGPRGIPLSALMRCQYVLVRKLSEKLASVLDDERTSAYQTSLFDDVAQPQVSFDDGFKFFDGMYDGTRYHEGKHRFQKHFTGWDQVPVFDGKGVDGEEGRCAQVIDALADVEFWIRNVSRHPNSFWLPLAQGKFYPDFVAKLKDGRMLVVEYKGAQLAENRDTAEKQAIGSLWEQQSKGVGLFIMVEKEKDGMNPRAQLQNRLK